MPFEAKTDEVRNDLVSAIQSLIRRAPAPNNEAYSPWIYHIQALSEITANRFNVNFSIGGLLQETAERYRKAVEREKEQRVEQRYKDKLGEKEAEVMQATAALQATKQEVRANEAKQEAAGETAAAQAVALQQEKRRNVQLAAELANERGRRAGVATGAQTEPAPNRSVSTNTEPVVATIKTYAEAATQAASLGRRTKGEVWEKGKGKGKENQPPMTHRAPTNQARTVVLHAAPTKFKPGQIRRWIEEDNHRGVQVQGIRWLTQEHRRVGKLASSLVIYLKEKIDLNHRLRIGRRLFRITEYDWSR